MPNVPPEVLALVLLPTLLALGFTAFACGVVGRCRTCWQQRGQLRQRARFVAPFAVILIVVLLFNALVRPHVDDYAPAVGVSATGDIYALEGEFVVALQSLLPGPALLYLSAVYVVGYALLLAFPVLAYAVLEDPRELASLLAAYSLNYAIGAVLYVGVVAYGPRNVYPEAVSQPLYEFYPSMMYLTSAINTNTNVFPSLHTSLSVTVLLFAWLTREEYPRWLAISAVIAPSVVLATMALSIHWLTDVVAGVALAVLSVHVARRVVFGDLYAAALDRLRLAVGRIRGEGPRA